MCYSYCISFHLWTHPTLSSWEYYWWGNLAWQSYHLTRDFGSKAFHLYHHMVFLMFSLHASFVALKSFFFFVRGYLLEWHFWRRLRWFVFPKWARRGIKVFYGLADMCLAMISMFSFSNRQNSDWLLLIVYWVLAKVFVKVLLVVHVCQYWFKQWTLSFHTHPFLHLFDKFLCLRKIHHYSSDSELLVTGRDLCDFCLIFLWVAF